MKVQKILLNDLRESLIYPTEILLNDSRDIRKYVKAHIAITNCKRILLIYPLLLILLAHNIIFASKCNRELVATSIIALSAAMVVISTLFCMAIIWTVYINRIDNNEELWKFKLFARTYLFLFLIIMYAISFLYIYRFDYGTPFVITVLLLCLFPIYGLIEYIITSVLSISTIYIAMYHYGYYETDNNVLFYSLISLMIVGLFAQIAQQNNIVFKEYIGTTTFYDPLTGLLNRRGANRFLEVETKKLNSDSPISLLMIDIDYFKKYNDAFGHDEGDECLKAVSGCIKNSLGKETKLLIRQGGEEFLIILPDVDTQKALECGETLNKAVYDLGLTTAYQEVAPVVTISVGVATTNYTKDFSLDALMKEADNALYRAKELGRNQVVINS